MVKFIFSNKLKFVMDEEDISVPATTVVPFIDTSGDATSKYHSFEFVSINYILEVRLFRNPNFRERNWWWPLFSEMSVCIGDSLGKFWDIPLEVKS